MSEFAATPTQQCKEHQTKERKTFHLKQPMNQITTEAIYIIDVVKKCKYEVEKSEDSSICGCACEV